MKLKEAAKKVEDGIEETLTYRCLARRHIFHLERFESGSLEETGGTQQPAIPKETRKPQKLF